MHELKGKNQKVDEAGRSGEVPVYLLDRGEQISAKVLSNTVKQKKAEKAVRLINFVSILAPHF